MKRELKVKCIYVGAILLVIGLGLSSRAFADHLPVFVSRHAGDALWGSMVYLGFRVLLTKYRRVLSLVLALAFCYIIEFSQLYQDEWINSIRSTLIGSLILGRGFLGVDLIRYAVGIGLAYVIESLFVLVDANA